MIFNKSWYNWLKPLFSPDVKKYMMFKNKNFRIFTD